MGRVWRIGFLALAFLVACNGNKQAPEPAVPEAPRRVEGPSRELSAIDSLLWQRPDSALTCLLPYFDTCKDTQFSVSTDRHYANLLLAELLYKNDYSQTNRMELLQAVGYFDSLTFTLNDHSSPHRLIAGGDPLSPTRNDQLFFLSARAHYINGVGYYEHDSVVDACKEYLKALEVMEEHFEEKEMVGKKAQFMAMTYTRLTVMFSDLYLHEQAIYFGKKSLKYYQRYFAESWYIAWMLNKIGSHYDILDNYDSAYFYCKQGLQILPDTNSLMYRDIATHLAFLSYEQGFSPDSSLIQLHTQLDRVESDQEYASRCLTIGNIFYHEQQYDSAWLYLNKVYNKSQRVGPKKQAAEWLAKVAEVLDRDAESHEFAYFLVPFANIEEKQSVTKSRLTELFNAFIQAQLQQQQGKENRKNVIVLVIIIVGLLSIVTPTIIILNHRNKLQKQDLETQIEAERHTYQIQQAALAGRLKRSNAALKEQSKLKNTIVPLSYSQHQTGAEKYIDEPICQHILAVCNDKSNPIKSTVPVSAYSNIALDDVQKAQLKVAALRHYGQMFEKLKHQHPELKEKDFYYCYLSLLGLDNVQIAVLQQKTISTIWDRENRLKKILGSEDKVSITLFCVLNH